MKLTVKTLKGDKFEVDVEEDATVAQVKAAIEATKSEIPAASTKMIFSGKVLAKDDETMSNLGIKEKALLVVMVSKPKKQPAAKKADSPAADAKPAATTETAAKTPAAKASSSSTTTTSSTAQPAVAATPAVTTTASTSTPPPAPSAPDYSAAASGLIAMGFPEAEVQHCLRVAQGNPDLAVEFLTNGIPEGISTSGMTSTPAAGSSGASSLEPLAALRSHPQLNDLRRLVQSNPQMLQQVLSQIGQQQPELLAEINQNQTLFLQMMNEPATESSASSSSNSASAVASSSSRGNSAAASRGAGGILGGGDGALSAAADPSQMAGLIQNMSESEVSQMAAMMGLSPEQLRQMAQMMGALPPEQLQQYMASMGAEEGAGMPGTVINLTPDEMAAVDRLTELGFDRSEAAQAFLACDKNEALAANLLMDSMNEGGDGFGGGFGGGNDDNNGNDDDDDDNMYD